MRSPTRAEIEEFWTGPDYESTSDDRCTCDVCGDTYEVWTDPTDQRPVTWCCETCWAKGADSVNQEHKENAA
jgi:hypothetical protein